MAIKEKGKAKGAGKTRKKRDLATKKRRNLKKKS